MIKTIILTCTCIYLATASYAQEAKEITWDSKTLRILEADEIVVQQNWFTKTPSWNIQKRIKYGNRYNKRYNEKLTSEERKEIHDLLGYDQSRDPNTVCGCRGTFQIEFRKNNELVFGIGYAHGRFTAPISKKAESTILQFLDSHGFPTEEWIKKEKEMEDANQTVDITRVSAPFFHSEPDIFNPKPTRTL